MNKLSYKHCLCICVGVCVRVHVLKFSAVGCKRHYFTSSVACGQTAPKPITTQFRDGGIHAQHSTNSNTNHHFTCTFNSDLVHNLISICMNITQLNSHPVSLHMFKNINLKKCSYAPPAPPHPPPQMSFKPFKMPVT